MEHEYVLQRQPIPDLILVFSTDSERFPVKLSRKV